MMVTPPSSSISMNESPLFSASMDPTLLAMATAAEHVDSSNWLDDFAAAPTPIQAALGLKWEWNPLQPTSVAMVASHIPFFHFNVASTLGIDSDQVDEPLLDSITAFFGPDKTHHITVAERFLDDTNKAVDESDPTTTPPPPHKIHEQLTSRGYTRYLPFDRVVLQDPTDDLVASWSEWGSNAELVTADNKDEWSSFLTSYYKMPDMIGEWLRQLVDRPHWFHAMLKKDGKVVMARSLYCQDGWAWLGIDAPVPGWGPTNCCDDDFVVCAKLLEAAAKEGGATSFVSDIEGPNVDQTGPDYDKWMKLGFTIPYKRMVYKWEPPVAASVDNAGEVEVKAT